MNKSESGPDQVRKVVLATIGAAHGVRGEVRMRSFTETPQDIAVYGPLTGSDGRTYEIEKLRPAGNLLIVQFAGIRDRNAAEALNGVELSVPRSVLDGTALGEEEFFHADLIGLAVEDAEGNGYGRIIAIHDFGGGDILELRQTDGRTRMIPFRKDAVPVVDLASERVLVEPVAAGLVDLPEEE